MAAGEGFEPSQTESESAVLPLHNPAISFGFYRRKDYYTSFYENVNMLSNKKTNNLRPDIRAQIILAILIVLFTIFPNSLPQAHAEARPGRDGRLNCGRYYNL